MGGPTWTDIGRTLPAWTEIETELGRHRPNSADVDRNVAKWMRGQVWEVRGTPPAECDLAMQDSLGPPVGRCLVAPRLGRKPWFFPRSVPSGWKLSAGDLRPVVARGNLWEKMWHEFERTSQRHPEFPATHSPLWWENTQTLPTLASLGTPGAGAAASGLCPRRATDDPRLGHRAF